MTERSLRSSQATPQCRICLQTNRSSSLIAPCDCRGSIQHVHLNCLQQYFTHRFKNCSALQRRRMKQCIKCEICHAEIKCLKVSPNKRCVTCRELRQRIDGEDVFFLVVYLLLYLGFHAVGVILVMQEQVTSRVIGAFWLLICVIMFNFGLYRIGKEVCFIREVTVSYAPG